MRSSYDVESDLKKMKVKGWKEKTRNREQWRLVEEAKAHPGLYRRLVGMRSSYDVESDLKKMRNREQWRLVVEEAKAHPGLYRRLIGMRSSCCLCVCVSTLIYLFSMRSVSYQRKAED
jgi:hypothetical protein